MGEVSDIADVLSISVCHIGPYVFEMAARWRFVIHVFVTVARQQAHPVVTREQTWIYDEFGGVAAPP
jgi:hypothetical protein